MIIRMGITAPNINSLSFEPNIKGMECSEFSIIILSLNN